MNNSALLVIDVQDSFRPLERWHKRGNQDFEKNLQKLIQTYRSYSLPIIYIMHTDEDATFTIESHYFRLMDFIDPQSNEDVIVKTTISPFLSTNLNDMLQKMRVKEVVITGIQTEQCCETTARTAFDLGYKVDFVTEATLTFSLNFNGMEVSEQELAKRTEWVLKDRFASIKTVDEVLSDLRKTCASTSISYKKDTSRRVKRLSRQLKPARFA